MIKTTKAIELYLGLFLLLAYITLDIIFTFSDSRSNAQAVLMAILIYPAVFACLIGSHFGYFFCLLLSGLLVFAPMLAMANVPERILTPYDIPVALMTLFLLLRKPVRVFFKEQRKNWQAQQAEKLQAFDYLELIDWHDTSFATQGTRQLFWRQGNQTLMFFPDERQFRAHKLEGIDQAQRIRKDLAAIAKQHLVFVGVAFCSIAAGLLAFSWEGYQSGEEKLIYIALPMLLMMPIMLITPLRQKRYYSQIKSEVTKTDLVIKPMQLFELYNTKNKNDQKKMKKMLRVGLVSFLLVAVVFALTVSPKMMEKRRADSALEETVEQMPM